MKRFVILLFLMIVFVFPSLSQNHRYRGVVENAPQIPDCKRSIQITFNERNYLMLLIDEYYDDIVVIPVLSVGDYLDSGDTFVLYDKDNESEWVLRKNVDGSLSVEKGFCTIVSTRLVYDEGGYDIYKSIEVYLEDCHLKQAKEKYLSQTDLQDLQYGVYEYMHPSAIGIDLMENGRYNYILQDSIFSKGNWERRGNLIEFYDDCLGKAFFALIEDGYIIPKTLPGNFRETEIGEDAKYRIIPEEEYEPMITPENILEYLNNIDSDKK